MPNFHHEMSEMGIRERDQGAAYHLKRLESDCKNDAIVGELSRLNTKRLISSNAVFKSKVGAMDGANKSLQEVNDELCKQLKSTCEKASGFESKVGAIDGENRSLQGENNELRRQLKSTREKASSLRHAQNNELRRQIKSTREKASSLQLANIIFCYIAGKCFTAGA